MALSDNRQLNPVRAQPDLCVVGGAGHVGLPLALVFASQGLHILIYDVDERAVELIRRGTVPFAERGAKPLLEHALENGRLSFASNPAAVAGIPTIVVTIGTPIDEFLNPVLDTVKLCIDDLFPHLTGEQLIVLRSTVSPRTTQWRDEYFQSQGKIMKVAFCPERVVQGRGIEEVQQLPQIVSGTTLEAENEAVRLFELIVPVVVRLSPLEAEFAKLFSNAYRYIQFAAANQFFMIANSAGADYHRILTGMKQDYARLEGLPGPGLAAGPCLVKDTMQLLAFANNQFSLGNVAMLVNEGLVLYIVDEIVTKYDLSQLRVGLLGMAFKADSDDTRSSLSYKLKKVLAFRAREVLTTDPHVTSDPDLKPLDEVIEESDLLIVCVPHSAYAGLDVKGKPVVDVWGYLR